MRYRDSLGQSLLFYQHYNILTGHLLGPKTLGLARRTVSHTVSGRRGTTIYAPMDYWKLLASRAYLSPNVEGDTNRHNSVKYNLLIEYWLTRNLLTVNSGVVRFNQQK